MDEDRCRSPLEDVEAPTTPPADQRPVRFTELAVRKVLEFAERNAEQVKGKALRMSVAGGLPGRYEYAFTFDEPKETDEVIPQGGFDLAVDRISLTYVEGSTVDYVEDLTGGGFVVNNPNVPDPSKDPLFGKVQKVLDEQINPAIAMHGGWVQLLEVREGTAYVQFGGGCQGCGMVDVTLKQGVERLLREQVPEITQVLDTTDHAAGANPYYQPSKGGGWAP